MADFNVDRLVSGGIITNYFCTSKCGHCLYKCGPGRSGGYITPETAGKSLRLVRRLGCKSVHIGGGEPMLRPDELGDVLETAARAGVSVEYVETNSSWFKDAESARDLLLGLREKGLRTLLVSISPFHNEFIPYSRVEGVMRASELAGINIFPWINGFIPDLSAFDPDKPHGLEEYRRKFGGDYLLRVLERYWVRMGGRAPDTFRPFLPSLPFREILDRNPGGCSRELSDTTHFHVDLFGNYIPGLCSGLSIAVQDLGRPLSENRYPVITTLFRSGIKGIYKLAQKELAYSPFRPGYINKCDLCTEIRTVFIKNDFGGTAELNPREFYDFF